MKEDSRPTQTTDVGDEPSASAPAAKQAAPRSRAAYVEPDSLGEAARVGARLQGVVEVVRNSFGFIR